MSSSPSLTSFSCFDDERKPFSRQKDFACCQFHIHFIISHTSPCHKILKQTVIIINLKKSLYLKNLLTKIVEIDNWGKFHKPIVPAQLV